MIRKTTGHVEKDIGTMSLAGQPIPVEYNKVPYVINRKVDPVYRFTHDDSIYMGNREAVAGAGVTRLDDLVLHWKLDESSGTTASDSSGNGRDGTLPNHVGAADGTDWVAGRLSGGLTFDGTNDYVEGPSSPALGENFTWTCWYKPATISGTRRLIIRFDLALYLNQLGASVFFYHAVSGTKYAGAATILTVDTWHFLAAKYDSTAASTRLMFRYAKVGTHTEVQPDTASAQPAAHEFTSTTSPFQAGRATSTASGVMDDVRWYSATLPDSDLNLIYNGGAGDL